MENKIDHITYTVTKKFQFKFYWNETTSIIFLLKFIRLTRIDRKIACKYWVSIIGNKSFQIISSCEGDTWIHVITVKVYYVHHCAFVSSSVFFLCHVWNNLFLNLLSSKNEKILSDNSFRHLWYFYILTSFLWTNLLNRPTGYRNIPEYIILTNTVKYSKTKRRPIFLYFKHYEQKIVDIHNNTFNI